MVRKTPLINSKTINKILGYKNLLIKDESRNMYGTYKDRRSQEIVKYAKKNGFGKVVLVSSGNACYSLSRICKKTKLKSVCVVDKNLKKKIKNEIKKHAHKIIETNLSGKLDSHEIIEMAREISEEKILDVSNGFEHAYSEIVEEVKYEKPEFIVVPVGSGEAFLGIYLGIKKNKMKTKIVGVGVKNKKKSFADKLHASWTPYRNKIKEMGKAGNVFLEIEEKEIKKTYRRFRKFLNCEPSSTIVFAAFEKIKFPHDSKIIVVNSGKGIY